MEDRTDVRPKRHTNPPTRFQDFEVTYAGHGVREQPMRPATPEEEEPLSQDGGQQFFPSAHPTLPHGDAASNEEPQQAQQYVLRAPGEFDPPVASSPHPRLQSEFMQEEIRVAQQESARLLQAQHTLQADLLALREVRSEIKEMIDVARALKANISTGYYPDVTHNSYVPQHAHPAPVPIPSAQAQVQPSMVANQRAYAPDHPMCPKLEGGWYPGFPAAVPEAQGAAAREHQVVPEDSRIPHLKPPTPVGPFPQTYMPKTEKVFLPHSYASSPPWYSAPQPSWPQPELRPAARQFQRPNVPYSPAVPPIPPVRSARQPMFYPAPPPAASATPDWRSSGVPTPHASYPPATESSYKGPKPQIPKFVHSDPSEFARLRIALDNLLPADATELFKYQVLVDHLRLDEARLIADAYLNSPNPYTDTMAALHEKFGQPHQLALRKIASVLDAPDVRRGDTAAFQRYALQVQSLVGLLKTLGPEGDVELQCGSHVARLLTKLPSEHRSDFRRHTLQQSGATPSLHDLSDWLRYESWCQSFDTQLTVKATKEKSGKQGTNVLHGASTSTAAFTEEQQPVTENEGKAKAKPKAYCPYCNNSEHYLSQCSAVSKLSTDQLKQWIQTNKRCWRCARTHQAAQCNLKKPCSLCQGKHLQALHEVNVRPVKTAPTPESKDNPTNVGYSSSSLYLDRPAAGTRVMLKVVPVIVHYGSQTLETYAILDDGSERTMLLPDAAKSLGIQGIPETLPLRTVRQDIQVLQGSSVSFRVSPVTNPQTSYTIARAFTSDRLSLSPHTYPLDQLQKKYRHLSGLPITPLNNAQPLLLIGSDQPHLITPIEPVRLGPPGGPAAVHTRLGWALQGPGRFMGRPDAAHDCLFTASVSQQESELFQHVQRLWQLDTVPHRSEKEVTRSKQDQGALKLLADKTVRTEVNGILRYATPLLRHSKMPHLNVTKESVMPTLRSTERRLLKDPVRAEAYQTEMEKLINASTIQEVTEETSTTGECWYIPHHLVSHNNKYRIVFNCSHQSQGQSLNQHLLPGPTLGASLLGVLLRFREHPVAVSGDIKGMFHQVRLLPGDRPLLRFLWRDLKVDEPPRVYEWLVLPFGTTCSPCCATYALQRHVIDNTPEGDRLRFSVEQCFYVDNCLQSVPSLDEAKALVDDLRTLLASAGFDLRQWACNVPAVLDHLPQEARSDSLELWLAQDKADPHESTLGLSWHWQADTLGYKHRPVTYDEPTLRNIYKVLATQYDPLGYLLPYTTRAKIIIRHLWDHQRGWDDPNLPQDLLQAWRTWEEELEFLSCVHFPRAYVPANVDQNEVRREVHIFSDASQQAYGAVAYLRCVDKADQVYLSFIVARSRVSPKRLHSIPRLELCGALVAAQLARLLERELTVPISQTTLWTDSTTVLTWLKSDSCRYKVFVGTRVSEIQELTEHCSWRFVDSDNNPADDLTRGRTLKDVSEPSRWSQGPPFLLQDPAEWPVSPSMEPLPDSTELRKAAFCGVTSVPSVQASTDWSIYSTWQELLDAKAQEIQQSLDSSITPSAESYRQAELLIFRLSQQESFPDDYQRLMAGKPVDSNSRLLTLSPEIDRSTALIRVGGRLRRVEALDDSVVHPVVLDPSHPATPLLISHYDSQLCHPGPERVFAEMRRSLWILRGREAIRKHQFHCVACQRWRARPTNPKMADLPSARLRLYKPAFYSSGVDCFGPFSVKIGRRSEKRWGIIYKCMTTRAVHLDLLTHLDADSFLLSLRRFIARRGTPAELLSDQGTNFKGAERELRETFTAMVPELQQQLAPQKIAFRFNPPAAPHFGGLWEREIRSVKSALRTTLGGQSFPEEVLLTVLLEVELILNSKPLGYVSADVADADPITPNSLLLGRPDGALPQVVYPETELLSRRRWRHAQILADRFWARFIRDYLPSLQTRQKWTQSPPNLKDKTIVMIMDPQLPRSLWPIGQVKALHHSDDGVVRSADVDVKGQVYTRPVARLVILPALPTGDDDAASGPNQPS